MTTHETLPHYNIKVSRQDPRRIQTNTTVSDQPEGCYIIPMEVIGECELQEEINAWEEASDEALEMFDRDFPPNKEK